jgi:hypothetical protein
MDDTGRALSALQALDPGCDREQWVRIGMAAKAAGVPLDDFANWSSGAANYAGKRDCAQVWRSINEGPIKAATLYSMAFVQGWQDPAKPRYNGHSKLQPFARTANPGSQPIAPARAGKLVSALWSRCAPATAAHPYIIAKNGTPDGLRVVPLKEAQNISGQSVAGWLVVPAISLDGELRTLQLIPAGEGKKLNMPGASFGDGLFVVGDLAQSARVFIVEGIGQAWACWSATGCAAVVCFGAGRVASVAAAVRAKYPAARLVLVPDCGKENQAAAIAAEVSGEWCELPADKPANYDASDYAAEFGADLLADLLERTKTPPKPEPRFKLLGSADIHALPPLRWCIRGVLPAEGVAALFGPSASGKSFLGFYMAAAIAEGESWFGCRVEAAPVVYLALEGEAGFRLRVAAWEQRKHRKLPERMRLVLQPFRLTDAKDVRELAAVVPAGAVVFIDTLNRAAPTADENNSRDMGEILEAVKQLQTLTGGLVVLIHHTGKDATKGLRGHSSLFAALDSAIEVSRDADRREWKVAKAKDGPDSDLHPFRLEVETLGIDEYGDLVTSCAVVADTAADDIKRVKLPQGGNQRVVLDALRPMFKAGETGKPGAPPLRPCLELEAAIVGVSGKLSCETSRRATRAREAITGLVGRGVLGCNEGWLWLAV